MKTCNDCIHEKICVIKAYPDAFENTQWEKEPCDHFKDKSLVLDLPCKVGATVFSFDDFYKRITEFQITGIEIVVLCKSLRGSRHAFSSSSFGKTLFHTREALEQALKGGVE